MRLALEDSNFWQSRRSRAWLRSAALAATSARRSLTFSFCWISSLSLSNCWMFIKLRSSDCRNPSPSSNSAYFTSISSMTNCWIQWLIIFYAKFKRSRPCSLLCSSLVYLPEQTALGAHNNSRVSKEHGNNPLQSQKSGYLNYEWLKTRFGIIDCWLFPI